MSENRSRRLNRKYRREDPNHRMGPFIISTVPRVIPLAFKVGLFYLGFKRKVKKAGKVFKKELIENGIDSETAQLLANEYMKSSHFFKGMRHTMFKH